nr:SPW repeat protein [Ktedonobacteraceae bacterium]
MMNSGRTYMTAPWTRWQDWCNLVLGVILFIAPWFTVSWSHMNSSWDAWILGVVIVLVSLWALATPGTIVPKVINLILGIWVFISPWILGFAYMAGIAWSAWIIGALVIILSAWALTQMQQSPTRAAV